MKKLIIATLTALMFAGMAGTALADYFWATNTPNRGDFEVDFDHVSQSAYQEELNSFFSQNPGSQEAVNNVEQNLSSDQWSFVHSSVANSLDGSNLIVGFFSNDSIKQAMGASSRVEARDPVTSGQYTIFETVLIDRTADSSKKIRTSVVDGVLIMETSTDGGSTWSTLSPVKTQTYSEWLTEWGTYSSSSSDAKTESRQEKAKVSSKLTNQMITTRVLNVFSPRPRPSKSGKSNRKDNTGIKNNNLFSSNYSSNAGLSSGDDAYAALGIGVWSMGSYATSYINTYRTDNNVGVFMAGVDKLLFDDKLAVGVGFGYENTWAHVKPTSYTEQGEGFSISPYAAYRVTDQFMVKGMLNSAFNSYDTSGGAQNYDGTRLMGDISGEYSWIREAWFLAAEVGFMYMNEDFNHNYTDVYLGEGRLTGKLGYEFENGLMPYCRGTFYQDLVSNSPEGLEDHTWEGTVGLNYYAGPWAFSGEIFDAINRDQNTFGGSLLVRFDF